MIEVNNIAKKYKGAKKPALSGITFSVGKGVTAVLGRNGAGKTTLMRILSTQLMPTSGSATLDGYDIINNPQKVREKIVSIPQEASPIGILTPLEHIIIYLSARGVATSDAKKAAHRAMKALDIDDVANKTTDELSGGMKRKVFVAMALASNAEVIFLDEPTTGLDPISRLEVWHAIRALKGTVVLTTHYMEEAKELAKDVILVDNGRIVARGTIEDLLYKYRNLVRIEGMKVGKNWHKAGTFYISYVQKSQADKYVGKNVTIKKFDLEDIFIMKGLGGNISQETESSSGDWE